MYVLLGTMRPRPALLVPPCLKKKRSQRDTSSSCKTYSTPDYNIILYYFVFRSIVSAAQLLLLIVHASELTVDRTNCLELYLDLQVVVVVVVANLGIYLYVPSASLFHYYYCY